MRFGGLVAVDDLSFEARQGRDHRADRAERRRQDHRIQLHHRLLQAERGPPRAAPRRPAAWDMLESADRQRRAPSRRRRRHAVPARAHAGLSGGAAGARRPHLPEHPPVPRHDGAGKSAGGPAQPADARLRLHAARRARLCRLTAPPSAAAIEKARAWLERVGLTARADDPAGDLPYGAQRRLEIARAMCTDPVLLCLDEPAAGLNPRESAELNAAAARDPRRRRHLGAADRARHVGGDGDFRPRRRARLRRQDRRRRAGKRCATTPR